MTKTTFQKLYSLLGFWFYYNHVSADKSYRVFYWSILLYGKFYRLDLFKLDVSSTQSHNSRMRMIDRYYSKYTV